MNLFTKWAFTSFYAKTRSKMKQPFSPLLLLLEDRTVPTVPIQTILPPNYGVTGVRQDIGNNVVITGGTGTPSLTDGTPAFIYYGPLSQLPSETTAPSLHLFHPAFSGETVTASQFYGPNTRKFDSTIPVGDFTAVGAYRYLESSYQNSMIYTGPLDGSGTYTKIVAPGNGTDPVADTIAHSTMGTLVVGNFVYQNDLTKGHGFIYDKKDQSYQTVDIGLYSTTIYGIWQNGGESSVNYSIIGGYSDVVNGGKAYIENYNSVTHVFSNFRSFSFNNDPTFITHFEGISAVKGGFSISATETSSNNQGGASYAFIPVNPDGTFGMARWVAMQNNVNGAATTGDTVIDYSVMGIYPNGSAAASFIATVSPEPLTPPNIVASPISAGLGKLTVFNPDGTVRTVFSPYGSTYLGGITVAQGDVNGDGMPDLITGTTKGSAPHVKVFDGKTLLVIQSFYAYQQTFMGGVNVAAGDISRDGHAEIITGAGPGGGPNVKVFDGATGKVEMSFYAYSPNFTGGVSVAAGDVIGDGTIEIITGAGAGGGPNVKVFSGVNGSTLISFMAYSAQFLGGVNVGSADLDGNGKWEILTGPGAGGKPNVKVFSGTGGTPKASFFAFPTSFTGGVMVSGGDLNFDGKADIITGTASLSAQVNTFDGTTLVLINGFTAFASPLGVGLSASR